MSKLAITGMALPDGSRTGLFVESGHLVDQHPLGAAAIDADGLIALPGLVNIHTHLHEPEHEDVEAVESGSHVAARGGFTAVFTVTNIQLVMDTVENTKHMLVLGAVVSSCQVFPIGAVTRNLAGREPTELGLMRRSRARAPVFSDDGYCMVDTSLMRRALEQVEPFDGMLTQYAQDAALAGPDACCREGEISSRLGFPDRPPVVESVIITRDVALAETIDSRLHVCHVSMIEDADVLRWVKERGTRVIAEVTPHCLYLTTPGVVGYGTTFKVNPPLRTDEHVETVWAALADGAIDVVATDHVSHAPQNRDHALVNARPGILGLEQASTVMMETMIMPGRLTWPQVAERMSHAPARIGKATGRGYSLILGESVNLVLIDPQRWVTVDRNDSASISHSNPYHGRGLPDPAEVILWNDRVTRKR